MYALPHPGEQLVLEFLARVWGPAHELDAIDELMTEDYRITTGGAVIEGRERFKAWVREFQTRLRDARTLSLDILSDPVRRSVVSRWVCMGANNGIFGLPPDGRPVRFTGIAIWRVHEGRLRECWVERSALEAYQALSTPD